MKTFIANFGRENYLWPSCHLRPAVATFEDEDTLPLWQANDREGYISHCIATKKTASGIAPTRPVASRWFNLSHIVSGTQGDLWIHREKDELWWTFSRSEEVELQRERAYKPDTPDTQIYVLYKETDPWSNRNRKGNRLQWAGLHPKAQDFLFTEGTLQQLGDDNAAYALTLIQGGDLRPWHSRSAWKERAKAVGRGGSTILNAKERSVVEMASTARETVAGARGQEVVRTVKHKELRFSTTQAFEEYIRNLLEAQEGLCAITGLTLQFYGEHEDLQLICSLDRINSAQHYEAGNLQIVCRFVNRWKGDQDDAEFRRLVDLVRSSGGFG